ncbi:MAG: class I SAM-dependent RNA methyltransferase [Fibrobacterota bacterium]
MAGLSEKVDLTCEKMIFGGLGLCRSAEGVVFIDGLLPGERARSRFVRKQGGISVYAPTEPIDIQNESQNRTIPFCPHFGVCGGCDWQHILPAAQTQYKKEIFEDLLSRVGKFTHLPAIEVFSGPDRGYRIRCQFTVDEKRRALGFLKKQSREVIPLSSCPLLSENIHNIMQNQKEILSRITTLPRTIRCIDTPSGLLTSPQLPKLSRREGEYSTERARILVRGDDFFQSNRYLIPELATWKEKLLQGESLLDLFGGAGFFALHHGKNFARITLVESSKAMARRAQKNFSAANMSHASVLGITAEHFFATARQYEFSTVIVDPPRPGLSKKVRAGLRHLSPKKLLYISCNPATQVRDLHFLTRTGTYEITHLAFFDMYPHTPHMETAAVLERI